MPPKKSCKTYEIVERKESKSSISTTSTLTCETSSTNDKNSSIRVNIDRKSFTPRNVQFGITEPATKTTKMPPKKTPITKKTKPTIRKHYFTAGEGINEENQRDLLKEPSPFVFPRDLEMSGHKVMTGAWQHQQRTKELALAYNRRHNYRTRLEVDLLNRMYVKEKPISKMKTVTDLDPDYFTACQGRPIKEKLDIRSYIQTVRDVLRMRIVTGFREDDIYLIEENLLLEQQKIDEIRAQYQAHIDAFEAFLYKDHSDSMNLLRESDEITRIAQEKYEELRRLSREQGTLRSLLYAAEEKWRNCKLYQRFLYLVSPLGWRKEHDHYYQPSDNLTQTVGGVETEEATSIFDQYRLNETEVSLENILNVFRMDFQEKREPKLYFTQPEQLLDVFRFLEVQNLNSLLYAEELAVPLESVRENMANAQVLFDEEIANLQDVIDKLAGGISWEEERAEFLEQLARQLINGEFKRLIVDEEVLNLNVLVEDLYETRIGPNDASLPMSEMMKGIEDRFRKELIFFDQLPSDLVSSVENKCYENESRIMKRAEKAARSLMEYERLFDKLTKVFAKPKRRTQKELKWRSPPVNPPKEMPPPPRSLTVDEQEYLMFFTDYCSHTDSLSDYGINTDLEPQSELYLKKNELIKVPSEDSSSSEEEIDENPEDNT